MGKELGHISKYVQMANKHIEKMLTIRETKIKTTVRHQLHLLGNLLSKD